MRIGILTFHCADNFGAVLQCYGLKNHLEQYDAEIEVINYSPKHLTGRYGIFPESRELKNKIEQKGLQYTLNSILWERTKTIKSRIKKKAKFARFRIKYIGIHKKKLTSLTKEDGLCYDIVIVGSDQVWNPKSNRGDCNYYLEFVNHPIKKVSYAASIGMADISEYQENMSEYLRDFDLISIREASYMSLIEKMSGKHIEVVLDPVFLLDKNKWEDMASTVTPFCGKFIFLYCFNKDDKAIALANALSRKYDLPIVHFYYGSLRNKLERDGKDFYFEGPLEFLWYIKNAEFIVSNSFHCTAFSIIFHKEFFSFLFQDRGARIVDLLDSLNLSDRVCVGQEVEDILGNWKKIDYCQVYDRMSKLKKKSYDYIDDIMRLCDSKIVIRE